jgi:hypothetical protein
MQFVCNYQKYVNSSKLQKPNSMNHLLFAFFNTLEPTRILLLTDVKRISLRSVRCLNSTAYAILLKVGIIYLKCKPVTNFFYNMGKCVPIYWAQICKLLRSPGIDSKKSIPPGYIAWRDGTTTLYGAPARRRNRFLGIDSWAPGSLKVFKFGLSMKLVGEKMLLVQ